jgi:hypothetical protein
MKDELKFPYEYTLLEQTGGTWSFGFDTTPGISGFPFPGQMVGDIFGIVSNSMKTMINGIDLISTVNNLKTDMGSPYTGIGEPGVNL